MMDRPFESRMAEIDVELRNLGEEIRALGTCLEAGERYAVGARSKQLAIADRRQAIMSNLAMLRARMRKAS